MQENHDAQHVHSYEELLGFMIYAWADVELDLYRVLKAYSNVSEPIARALFGNSRAKDFISKITNVLHNTNAVKVIKDDLEYVFKQIIIINDIRDRIIHNSYSIYSVEDEKRLVTERLTSKKFDSVREHLVDMEFLMNIYDDLRFISERLTHHFLLPRSEIISPVQKQWKVKK